MLQRIREKTSGWFAGLVIVTIGIVFALWGVYGYLGANAGASDTIAKVNGQAIDKQTYQAAYQREQQSLVQSQKTMDPDALQKRVLDGLIDDTLRLQDAEKNNFRVGGQLIDNFIASNPEFHQNGKFSPEVFERQLAQIGQTPSSYYQLVKASLSQYYFQIALAGSEFVLPSEIARDFAIAEQKRTIDYVNIPIDPYLTEAAVTPDQIQAFYKEHQKKFLSPEQVVLNYVALSSKDLIAQMNPSDADLQKYYDQ